ncbi:MAG: GNAT family N-acetyltransferase [Rhodanobacteraceae bacterium]|nr:MAG: GNAT family N-acetyltransferase [Rhodanobacteraceae bacterium]
MRGAPHIRPATAEDRAFILSLVPRFVAFDLPAGRQPRTIIAATRADLARALRAPTAGEYCFVGETADGAGCGFLRLQLQRDFFSHALGCHVADLAVVLEHEGQGFGHALLDYARRWARRHRCQYLSLSVFPGNARARSLYASAGFHADLLRLVRPLSPCARAGRNPAPRPDVQGTAQRPPPR